MKVAKYAELATQCRSARNFQVHGSHTWYGNVDADQSPAYHICKGVTLEDAHREAQVEHLRRSRAEFAYLSDEVFEAMVEVIRSA